MSQPDWCKFREFGMLNNVVFIRSLFANITPLNKKEAAIVEETLTPDINLEKITADAIESLVLWFCKGLTDNIFTPLGNYTHDTYMAFKHRSDVQGHFPDNSVPADYPLTPEQIGTLNIIQCVALMYFFVINLHVPCQTLTQDAIILAFCSSAKKGQITEVFCQKISILLRDELVVQVKLLGVNTKYKNYMDNVNETNAQDIFQILDLKSEDLNPDTAQRLMSGCGLKLYIIICRAVLKYYDFPWDRVNTLTRGEVQAWTRAFNIVRGNFHYGLRQDLGRAKFMLYKSVGYVARELLVKINGERTLLRYARLNETIKNKNIKNKDVLDQMIETYVNNWHLKEKKDSKNVELPLLTDIYKIKPFH